jgi:hypothetical protein
LYLLKEKEMNWIRVKDRIPSYEELRQLRAGYKLLVTGKEKICEGVMKAYDNEPPFLTCDSKHWQIVGDGACPLATSYDDVITHWMIVRFPDVQ